MRSELLRKTSVLAVVAVVVAFTASLSWATAMTPIATTGYTGILSLGWVKLRR